MAPSYFPFALFFILNILGIVMGTSTSPLPADDIDLIQVALNLEFLETEFFLNGALGKGLDSVAPQLAAGGPPPNGAERANLDFLTNQIIQEFGFQEIGHLRAIITSVGGFSRPQLDLSSQNFAMMFDQAVAYKLVPPFNPHLNTINYLLASYVIPYVGLVGYVGTIPNLANDTSRSVRTRNLLYLPIFSLMYM